MAVLEVCAGTLQSVHAAAEGGAPRIELCSALELDGLTPEWETLRRARSLYPSLIIHVLIRPRPGDFCYGAADSARMRSEIRTAMDLGADGIAVGCLTPEGEVDIPAMEGIMEIADNVTFHRAFDLCRDPFKALEEIIGLGCRRILTSGQERTAFEGIGLLSALRERSAGRIIILPGSGVTPQNARVIISSTGCTEIHSSASVMVDGRKETSAATVAAILADIRHAG